MRPTLSTIQRARLCAFECEDEVVVISAAILVTVVARCSGSEPVQVAPDLPVLKVASSDCVPAASGGDGWEQFAEQIQFTLLSISPARWTAHNIATALKPIVPGIVAFEPESD